MNRKSLQDTYPDLDRVSDRMHGCSGLLYAIADSGLTDGRSSVVDSLFGVIDLLELAIEELQHYIDADVLKGGLQHGPKQCSVAAPPVKP